MSWRDFLTASLQVPGVLLLAYGLALFLGFVQYISQVAFVSRFPRPSRAFLRRGLARRSWPPLLLFAVLPVAGGYVGTFDILTGVLGASTDIAHWVGVVIGVAMGFLFVDGLRFVGRPAPAWYRNVAESELPVVIRQVHWRRRARIGLQVYWYVRARHLPTVAVAVAMGSVLRETFVLAEGVSSSATAAGLLVGMATTGALYLLVLPSIPRRIAPAAAAILRLSEIAKAMEGVPPRVHALAADGDPLDWSRSRLRWVTQDLVREARRLDRTLGRAGPHPVGSILRAVASRIGEFVANEASLVDRLPLEIKDLVGETLLVLAGPARGEPYRVLAKAVSAFDDSGSPTNLEASRRFRPATLGRALTRAGEGSEALRRVVVLGVLLAILIAYLAGRLDPGEIGQIRP